MVQLYHLVSVKWCRCPVAVPGVRLADGAAALLAVRLRYSVSSSVTKHLPRSPIAAHTAIALDSATGGGQSRGRCHSLRQSTSHNVTFSASGKFHLCLGFSSPHKAGFAGAPVISFFVCLCGSISSLRMSVINSNKAFSVSTVID